jgi:hypothetical protein
VCVPHFLGHFCNKQLLQQHTHSGNNVLYEAFHRCLLSPCLVSFGVSGIVDDKQQ